MSSHAPGSKGLKTEELVRAYFLMAGFFVLRGIVCQHEGAYLTDIDIWIYERSATLGRRRTIIDIKDKKTPQAAERMFFVKGLAEVIGVEAAGVATSDNRPILRGLARRHGLLWIDGDDLQRLKASQTLAGQERLSEEEFNCLLTEVDGARGQKGLRESVLALKSAVANRFGAGSANSALEMFKACSDGVVKAYPGSPAATTMTRVSYLAASLAAAGFDFASADTALRPSAERVHQMADAIKLGADIEAAWSNLRWTEAAVREFLPNGSSLAQTIRRSFENQIKAIPAGGLAEIIVKLSSTERLFSIARQLEQAAYAAKFVGFDALDADAKGFLGALLDFSNTNRQRFAEASGNGSTQAVHKTTGKPTISPTENDEETKPKRDDRLL